MHVIALGEPVGPTRDEVNQQFSVFTPSQNWGGGPRVCSPLASGNAGPPPRAWETEGWSRGARLRRTEDRERPQGPPRQLQPRSLLGVLVAVPLCASPSPAVWAASLSIPLRGGEVHPRCFGTRSARAGPVGLRPTSARTPKGSQRPEKRERK